MNEFQLPNQRWQINAFCGKGDVHPHRPHQPIQGNPAEVFLLPHWPKDLNQLQQQAAAGPLPTSVFVVADSKRGDHYHIRWFNRVKQIQRCGHGTLAAAYLLWKQGYQQQPSITFLPENSENINASSVLDSDTGDINITLNMPTINVQQVLEKSSIGKVLNCQVKDLYNTEDTEGYYIVVVDSEAELMAIAPNPSAIAQYTARAVIVTCLTLEKPYQLAFRYFAPQYGVNEDQVTGSAARLLSHFYYLQTGRSQCQALQVSSNGGLMTICYRGDNTTVTGQAQIITRHSPSAKPTISA